MFIIFGFLAVIMIVIFTAVIIIMVFFVEIPCKEGHRVALTCPSKYSISAADLILAECV